MVPLIDSHCTRTVRFDPHVVMGHDIIASLGSVVLDAFNFCFETDIDIGSNLCQNLIMNTIRPSFRCVIQLSAWFPWIHFMELKYKVRRVLQMSLRLPLFFLFVVTYPLNQVFNSVLLFTAVLS